MQSRSFFVCLMASGPMGWLYVGVTNDLARRADEHRRGQVVGYTREHGIDQLVWFERHAYINRAILREKRIKRWRREWKYALVEESNPQWLALSNTLDDATRRPAQP